ncbi:unnamed protein product [Arabis nemorensis]|uniref:Uncharacterized protein n=1 Tax=Arabis nemorensis TaxID=586526 RepID=A0A565CIU0_9BRAS|nr:unnamed protein product [Arabis nemorensis]
MEIPPSQSPATPLRRRNSIATLLTSDKPFPIVPSSPSSFDFELVTLKPSSFVAYTSLRDILTSSSSPSNSSVNLPAINGSSGDISIRNRLVKQAAWSYLRLQPTAQASSENSPRSQFLRRIWLHFSAGIQFLKRMIDWIFQSIRIPQIVK